MSLGPTVSAAFLAAPAPHIPAPVLGAWLLFMGRCGPVRIWKVGREKAASTDVTGLVGDTRVLETVWGGSDRLQGPPCHPFPMVPWSPCQHCFLLVLLSLGLAAGCGVQSRAPSGSSGSGPARGAPTWGAGILPGECLGAPVLPGGRSRVAALTVHYRAATPSRETPRAWGLHGQGRVFTPAVSPEKSLEQELATPILDIEDLVKSGNKHK